jgi:hypothetical protein
MFVVVVLDDDGWRLVGVLKIPGLCGRTLYLAVSRVPDIQFTRELFLRVPDVYIYLDVRGKLLL